MRLMLCSESAERSVEILGSVIEKARLLLDIASLRN